MKKKLKLKDFQKAQQTIIDYLRQDFLEIHGDDRPCICCGEKIKPIHPEMNHFPQTGMYENGIVDKISAGFGSQFDGDMFIIAICDKCIEKLKKENKIEYAGNYMHLY